MMPREAPLGLGLVALAGCWCRVSCTQANLFDILLNSTEIRLYLPCTDLFGTANRRCPVAVLNQSENCKYNLISV